MGAFESIGRTNTLANETSKLSDMVLNLRKQDTEAQRYNEEIGMKKQELASNLKTNELNQNLLSTQIAEQKRKDEAYNRIIDVKQDPAFRSLPNDESRNNMLKMLQESGAVDAEGKGKTGAVDETLSSMFQRSDKYQQALGPVIKAKEKELIGIQSQISDMEADAKEKGKDLSKDKKYLVLKAQEEKATKDYQSAFGGYHSYLNELTKYEQEQEKAKALAEETRKTQAAKIDALKKAGLGATGKPTAKQREAAGLKESYPYADPAAIDSAIFNFGTVKMDKAIQAGLDAQKWALDSGQTDDPDVAKALGDRVREDTEKAINDINNRRNALKAIIDERKGNKGHKVGDTTIDSKGIKYKKTKEGDDKDKSNWEKVK